MNHTDFLEQYAKHGEHFDDQDKFDLIAHSDRYYDKMGLVSNPKIGPRQLDILLDPKNDFSIRMRALDHPNLSKSNLEKALDAPDFSIRSSALNHSLIDSSHISKAINDPSDFVRAYAAAHPKATHEAISKGLDDPEWSVRVYAASNPNTTKEHLTKALSDEIKAVRYAATKNPSYWTHFPGGHNAI